MFLTAVVALCTLAASAQFMVVTTYDGDQTENIDKLTANMGVGYTVMDGIIVGVVRASHDHVDGDCHSDDENEFELFARYDLGNFMEGAYLSAQMPTEDMTDNMKVGLGVSFNVWNGLNVEPNYTMPAKSDDNGDREGSFNIGLSYSF